MKLKSFTLLELLVVMGIIAVLGGLGVTGLTRFQANTQVQTAFNDVFSILKTLQNSAENSIAFTNASAVTPKYCSSLGPCVPDYYGIKFTTNTYTVYGCLISGNNIICSNQNMIQLGGLNLSSVVYSFSGSQCDYILFQRLTGDIIDVSGDPTWSITANSICTLRISNSFGDSRVIEINLTSNSIRDAGV